MARSRSGVPFIGKLLNSTTQPVYVLDSQRIIQFCNDACCAWTGLTEEQLLGVRCDYHTAPDGNETMRIAAGLCPPPEVYQGKACSALVGLRRPDGNFSQREARFTPFGGADGEVEAVLSIVDAFDRPLPPITSTAIESSELLHARLRKLRNSLGSQYRLEQLVGDSPASHRLREQVHVATTSESSVLILGSPGSGREHVARTIHYARSTGRTPLIPIDSELTDAGSLELALASASNPLTAVSTPSAAVSGTRDHGSAALLLLNLDKLPRDCQAILAQFLEYTPLRLFATASQPLLPLARADEYRMDLACAASVFVMEIPALSERRSDIRWIAQMLLEQHNQLGQRQFSGFAPDAMTLLEAYPWPGQMEELLRAVKQAAEAASSPTIMGHDLPESIRVWGHVHSRRSTPVTPIVLDHFLEEIQRELIARTLARTRNNRSKAAEMLGISRPRLLRLIEQLGLQTAPAELEDQPDFQERTDDPRDEDG